MTEWNGVGAAELGVPYQLLGFLETLTLTR
jgi:hypothetical protein